LSFRARSGELIGGRRAGSSSFENFIDCSETMSITRTIDAEEHGAAPAPRPA
jgi:hypothetical protein